MIRPVEYKVLVLPDEVEKVTKGGIYIPDEAHEKQQMATEEGEIVAVGGNAFEGWVDPVPKVGDRVCWARYAGKVQKNGTKTYRAIQDKEIIAILD